MDFPKTLNKKWFELHPQFKPKTKPPMLNGEILHSLWPISEPYESLITTIYSPLIPQLDYLNSEKYWVFRDGLIPLLWFFNKFKAPKNLKTTIFIYKSHIPYVPAPWQKYIGSYELYTSKTHKKRTHLGFLGILSDSYMSDINNESIIKKFSKNFNNQSPSKLKKFCFLPCKPGAIRHDIAPFIIQHSLLLGKYFGNNIQSLSYNQILGLENYKNCYFIDLNNHLLSSDNGILHYSLSKGGVLWQGRLSDSRLQKDEKLFPLSEHHGFILNQRPKFTKKVFHPKDTLSLDEVAEVLKITKHPVNTDFPWPDLFEDWVQSLIIQSE